MEINKICKLEGNTKGTSWNNHKSLIFKPLSCSNIWHNVERIGTYSCLSVFIFTHIFSII